MARLPVFAALAVTMLCLNCNKESVTPITLPYHGLVDQRLIPYFQTFEKEGALRGVNVNLNDVPVTGTIASIQEDNIAGTCSYQVSEPHAVTIDLEYWNAASTLGRELVVFHELGHCYLGRGHLETAFANGICTSIMNSGTSGCYIAYTAANRDYYLDELFSK